MFKRILSALLLASVPFVSYPATKSGSHFDMNTRQSVGLVLSGGGAKGIAHIGVIKALEENGIPIDYITGTSMGAIVGGLYACGYSPDEILALILSDEFSSWSTGTIDQNRTFYYLKPERTPAIVTFNLGGRDSIKTSGILPSSFINPLPMNLGFLELFTPHTALCKGDFDNLFVPFRCVASDVYNKKKIILSSGNLGDAIRMSMTFPVAFKPIEYNGVPIFDGGIYDNFPINVMREDFAPDVMIGVDVAVHGESDTSNLISQLESMIIQEEDNTMPDEDGIKIHVDLKEYGLLDFPKANAISKKGYDRAMEFMDSIKERVSGRISAPMVSMKREIYKSQIPEVKFDSVKVVGVGRQTGDYLKYVFSHNRKGPLSMEDVKDAYYRSISSGKVRDLLPIPEPNKESDDFDLILKATVKDNYELGVGGYITSNTNNMVFVSAGYETMDMNSFSSDIMGWIGQSYYGGLFNAKFSMLTKLPTLVKIQLGASKQRFYEDEVLFFDDDLPTFITTANNYANVIYGIGLGRHGKMEAKAGFGYLKDLFYPTNNVDFATTKQDEGHYKLGQFKLSYEQMTLNNEIFPSSGLHIFASVAGIVGKQKYVSQNGTVSTGYQNVSWIEGEFNAVKYFEFGNKFSLGTNIDIVASNKKLYDNYTATIIQAPAFTPTQSIKGVFSPKLRANSFVAGGVIPVFKLMDNLQVRTEMYAFSPMRAIMENPEGKPFYGGWFDRVEFMGEASLVYNFSFASLSVYANYFNYPTHNWNFGLSFGAYITVPKFLR